MMVLGSSGPRTRSRAEPIVRDSTNSGSRAAPKSHRAGPAPFRSPPRDAFFSIEGSRLQRDNQAQSRPNSRLYDDPLQEYFPSITLDHDSPLDLGVSSRSQSRSESVPIPNADSFEASDDSFEASDVDATRSTTAPPYVDLSLKLSDLANLDMSANDITTVGIEKEQEKFKAERRLTISSAMGARQHGSPRPASLGVGVATRRKRLEREHAYLRMKFRERPCLRTESFLNQDLADEVNDMSRECCDVLGPKACHECDRLNRRSNSALRNEANFPSLHISAANFSSMTMVNQVRPDLSSREVLEKLAQGDITRPQSLRNRKSTSKTGDDEEDDDKSPKRKISISAFSVPDGQGYFTNFTDLRAQIFARQGKNHTWGKRFNGAQNMNNLPVITNVEVLPKKESERENPANYFGPPMMSREEIKRQQSQPRFYAGAQGKYELPEAPSLDEIVKQATGARHQKLRQLEPRSETPDSDISFRSLKSPLPEENLRVDQEKTDDRKSNLDVNANENSLLE